MKISYAITVKDELNELQRLVNFLIDQKRTEDEIVILYDSKGGSEAVEEWLRANSVASHKYRWYSRDFDNHFADHKNYLGSLCTGTYIFQIDADEIPHEYLIEELPSILKHNSAVDLYAVPRVNTVEGLTPQHIQKWGWNINENGWVNWPDFQTRIYKNIPEIKWVNKVHERLDGHKQFAYLPMEENWALYHSKTIERQEKQNNYYKTL
jgi:hypothetical protein